MLSALNTKQTPVLPLTLTLLFATCCFATIKLESSYEIDKVKLFRKPKYPAQNPNGASKGFQKC
jgi:hypothetical protein